MVDAKGKRTQIYALKRSGYFCRMESKLKKCSQCLVLKPPLEFYVNRGKKSGDGLQGTCKTCARAQHSQWFRANRVKGSWLRRDNLPRRIQNC